MILERVAEVVVVTGTSIVAGSKSSEHAFQLGDDFFLLL